MNHTMLCIKCNNTDSQWCKHRQMMVLYQTKRGRWQKQRHPLELNMSELIWKCTQPRESYEAYTQDKKASTI